MVQLQQVENDFETYVMNVTNILTADCDTDERSEKIILPIRFRIFVVAIEKHMIILSNRNHNAECVSSHNRNRLLSNLSNRKHSRLHSSSNHPILVYVSVNFVCAIWGGVCKLLIKSFFFV